MSDNYITNDYTNYTPEYNLKNATNLEKIEGWEHGREVQG